MPQPSEAERNGAVHAIREMHRDLAEYDGELGSNGFIVTDDLDEDSCRNLLQGLLDSLSGTTGLIEPSRVEGGNPAGTISFAEGRDFELSDWTITATADDRRRNEVRFITPSHYQFTRPATRGPVDPDGQRWHYTPIAELVVDDFGEALVPEPTVTTADHILNNFIHFTEEALDD